MLSDLLCSDSVAAFKEALGKIERETPGKFGTLDASGMMVHLRLSLDASLGYSKQPDRSRPFVRGLLWIALFRVFKNWPKGVLKTPDAFAQKPEDDFETERALLLERIDEFVELARVEPQRRAVEPDFGNLSLAKWRRFHGVHFKHHLKQFGAI